MPSFAPRLLLLTLLALLGVAEAHAAVYNMNLTTGTGVQVTVHGAVFAFTQVNAGSGTYTRMFGVDEQQKDAVNTLPTGSAQAYNDATKNNLPFNQKTGNGFNPALTIGDLPVVTIGTTKYLQLLADYNGSSLTLADLRIYASPTAGVDVSSISQISPAYLGQLIYSFDTIVATGTADDNTINVTAIPSGSGYSDMSYNIPLSAFGSLSGTTSLYVYVRYDNQVGGGYQEIAYDRSGVSYGSTVPEARTVWGGLSIGLLLCGSFIRNRFRRN